MTWRWNEPEVAGLGCLRHAGRHGDWVVSVNNVLMAMLVWIWHVLTGFIPQVTMAQQRHPALTCQPLLHNDSWVSRPANPHQCPSLVSWCPAGCESEAEVGDVVAVDIVR